MQRQLYKGRSRIRDQGSVQALHRVDGIIIFRIADGKANNGVTYSRARRHIGAIVRYCPATFFEPVLRLQSKLRSRSTVNMPQVLD